MKNDQNYLESLCELYKRGNYWKVGSLILAILSAFQMIAVVSLSNRLTESRDNREYLVVPGAPSIQTVRSGVLPKTYIEESFKYVIEKINSFTWKSMDSNFEELFNYWYSHNLKTRTEANLQNSQYSKKVKSRELVSTFRYLPNESQYNWCGKLKLRGSTKGVACGIVTGVQELYSKNVPISSKKLHFLVLAINTAPTQENPFAIKIERIKRGPKSVLQADLQAALKDGVLPPEEGDSHEG